MNLSYGDVRQLCVRYSVVLVSRRLPELGRVSVSCFSSDTLPDSTANQGYKATVRAENDK